MRRDHLPEQTKRITIFHVEQDGEDGVLVRFSDGTYAGYVVEELLQLRPTRELRSEPQH